MNKRNILGVVIAPLVAPLLYYMGSLLISTGNVESVSDFFAGLFLISFFAVPVSYLASIILGLPAVYFLKKYDSLNLRNLVAVAFVLGSLVFIVFVLSTGDSGISSEVTTIEVGLFVLSGGGMASAVAVSYWYISGIASAHTETIISVSAFPENT